MHPLAADDEGPDTLPTAQVPRSCPLQSLESPKSRRVAIYLSCHTSEPAPMLAGWFDHFFLSFSRVNSAHPTPNRSQSKIPSTPPTRRHGARNGDKWLRNLTKIAP